MAHDSTRTRMLGTLVLLGLLVSLLMTWLAHERSHVAPNFDRSEPTTSPTEQESALFEGDSRSSSSASLPVAAETKGSDGKPASIAPDDDAIRCWLQVADFTSGAPLQHVKITAELGVEQAISYTDRRGYANINGSKTQPRLLQLDFAGYSTVFTPVEVGHERAERPVRILMSRTATLRAHVRFATSVPAADAQVTLEARDQDLRERRLIRPDAVDPAAAKILSETDPKGSVTIPCLPAGIAFHATVFHPKPWSPPEEIVLEPGEVREVDWMLSGGCLLRGLLLDADEHPVARRRVWMSMARMDAQSYFTDASHDEALVEMTDDEGRFMFFGVDPASWWVGPAPSSIDRDPQHPAFPDEASDVAPLGQLVRIDEGQTIADVTLHVDRGVFIRGRVVDSAGAGVGDAHVRATDLEQGLRASARTTEDGSFTIGPLIRGRYTLVAMAHRQDADSSPVEADGGESNVVLHLRAGATLAGQVIGENEVGVSATLSVCDRSAQPAQGRGMHTDPHGMFVLRGLSPGAFDVAATTDDGRVGVLEKVEAAGGVAAKLVVVRVTKGGQVRVLHAGPEASVELEVLQHGALISIRQTLRNVPVELTVPSGTVTIRAQYPVGNRRTVERSLEVAVGAKLELRLEAGAH